MTKKLPQPLLGITWFYMLTSVLGALAYSVLTFGCDMLGLHDFPLGTFGSRFHAYLLITVGLDDNITGSVGLSLLAVCIGWVIALLFACIVALWKKKYRFSSSWYWQISSQHLDFSFTFSSGMNFTGVGSFPIWDTASG